jgi:hypothetical protein
MLLNWELTENEHLEWKILLSKEEQTEAKQNAEYLISAQ